jgi:twitching motility two-component system response regulator PilH
MATVLIVDDSPTEVHVLTRMLESCGYTTLTANNGDEGVELAKNKRPDVVLMDVVMPGTNGFQATRMLAKNPETSDIPVIIISTKDQETDRTWGIRQGAKHYLVKPVTERELITKVEEVLRIS